MSGWAHVWTPWLLQPKALCEEPLDHDSWLSQCKEATAKFEEVVL